MLNRLGVSNVTLVEGMCVSAKAHVHEIAGWDEAIIILTSSTSYFLTLTWLVGGILKAFLARVHF